MENKSNYNLICQMAGFDGNYAYHKIFRQSYAAYLEEFAIPILEKLEFSRAVFVFLDHYTWNEEGNINLPLPYGMGRYISDFALHLFTGAFPDSDAINNFECFFNLLMYKDQATDQHVPIVLFNLFPTEGTHGGVPARLADMVNRTAMRDLILEDVRNDLQKVEQITRDKEKFFLFAVRPDDFYYYMSACLGGSKLHIIPKNFANVMNCGGEKVIDHNIVTQFMQTINKPHEDLHEMIGGFLGRLKHKHLVGTEALFNHDIPIEEWMQRNLLDGLKIYAPKDNDAYIPCSVYCLNIDSLESMIPDQPDTGQSFCSYREYELAINYHYQSRTITTWSTFYEASDSLKRVMLIHACFRDFMHHNPYYGEWEYYFVANELVQQVMSLIFTHHYCSGSYELSEAFETYLAEGCPNWVQIAFEETRKSKVNPLDIYNNVKNGKGSVGGETFQCIEEIILKVPLYLPVFPAHDEKYFTHDVFDAIRKSIAFHLYKKSRQEFDAGNPSDAAGFNRFYAGIKNELKKRIPADYYTYISDCLK